MKRLALALVTATSSPAFADQDPPPAITTARYAEIASGKHVVIDSVPYDHLLDAQVDIGTLKRVGDAYEVAIIWPHGPEFERDQRQRHPELTIPRWSYLHTRERVVCAPHNVLFFEIESTLSGPDGESLLHGTADPIAARRAAEALNESAGMSSGYSPNPRSLVCWAVARKCKRQPFSWPPPRGARDADYVPSCTLR